MNRKLIFITVFLLLAGCSFWRKAPPAQTPSPTPQSQSQVIGFAASAPFLSLTPRSDANALIINFNRVSDYQAIEVKVQYQTGDGRSQGFLKTFRPEGKDTVEGEGLFGSCSRGVCKYDQGVNQGTIEVALRRPDGKEVFWKGGFTISRAKAGETVRSADGKLIFQPAAAGPVVIFPLLGLPAGGIEVFNNYAYGIFVPQGEVKGAAKVTFFEKPADFAKLEISYWDGQSWQPTPTGKDESKNELSASIVAGPVVVSLFKPTD